MKILGNINDAMTDRYSAMQVGYLVTAYLDANDGQWPKGWEDLNYYYDADSKDGDGYLLELKRRVHVDWSVDVEALAAAQSATSPPFPVVECVSGRPAGPTEHHEANQVIFEYLRESRRSPANHPLQLTSQSPGVSDAAGDE